MPDRLEVLKTYKLYINGAFPRSESGRSDLIRSADDRVMGHSCKASRKDLRDAVIAARAGMTKWKAATPYNRGQVLYRMAEMLEGKKNEFVSLLNDAPHVKGAATCTAEQELLASVDRLIAYAGWADKYAHVLGCQNHVAAPYWNITVPEATGVVGIVPGKDLALLGTIALVAPVICAGNGAVVLSEAFAPVVSVLGEVCATSDLPAGVLNLLTGSLDELVPVLAKHRDVDAIHALAGPSGASEALVQSMLEGSADNLKRIKIRASVDLLDAAECASPWWIEPFVEMKTVWHPVGA